MILTSIKNDLEQQNSSKWKGFFKNPPALYVDWGRGLTGGLWLV